MPTAALNTKARYEYEILETFEAGIVLLGHEVKSVRNGAVSLKGSYVTVSGGELFLLNMRISPYPLAGTLKGYDPTRTRKLLLKQSEIARLIGAKQQKGLTLVPLSVYTRNNRVKVKIGLARGKKLFEKRELIKKRDIKRHIEHALKRAV